MIYTLYGDTLRLAHSSFVYEESSVIFSFEQDKDIEVIENRTQYTYTEEETISFREYLNLLKVAFTEETLNYSEYSWLDGKIFTQEEQQKGYIDKAIELGEEGYNAFIVEANPDLNALLKNLQLEMFVMMGGDEYVPE